MTIWNNIESAPASAPLISWRHRFGGDVASLAGWFLANTEARASHIACPRQCSCIHRVTADNLAVCTCDDCDPIPVSSAELEIWSADWPAFGTRVRQAFDLQHKTARFPVAKVWQIGAFGGDALQIILVVQPDRREFNEAIAQLVARVPGRFVILTPTLTHHDIQSRELLERIHAGYYDLESNLSLLPSGRLVAKRTAGELFSRHLPESHGTHDAAVAKGVIAGLSKLKGARRSGKQLRNKAHLYDVFVLTVIEGLSQRAAAKQCGCSAALISERIDALKRELGFTGSLKQLQALAASSAELRTAVKGQRYRKEKYGAPENDLDEDNDSISPDY